MRDVQSRSDAATLRVARDTEATLRAGFGHAVDPGTRPAIVVVDFSRGFTDPRCATGADMTAAVEATRRLLEVARGTGCPVVFTTIAFGDDADGGVWLQKAPGLAALREGSELVEIDARLGRRPEDLLIVKKAASAFFGTHLASILVSQRRDTVIVCGATTSGCVRATVVDAMQCGFPTLVPRECVADRAQGPHEASLFDMHAKYADVLALEETMTYLESVSPAVPA